MDPNPTPDPETTISERVRDQYARAPFPPVQFMPVVKGPPQQRVWLYSYTEAYYHAFRVLRSPEGRRLLDAGCGTGHGVHQIRHLAPGAEVHACDFSAPSLAIARQRIEALDEGPVTFHEMNLLDLSALPGEFDAIFCSGVVHHTANPVHALQQLKSKLKPDGVLYLMLYSQFGRRPTLLMQRAIKLLNPKPGDQQEGLRIGRMIFEGLPDTNPIATWEREKWHNNHRKHDEAFIDMYVNANEKNYTVREVCADLAAADLRLVRFANPVQWNLAARMNATPELLERFQALPEIDRYEVIEHLFPERDQYLFFATHAGPEAPLPAWTEPAALPGLADRLTATRSPFTSEISPSNPRPMISIWSGYFGQRTQLDASSLDLLKRCDGRQSVAEIVTGWERDQGASGQGRGAGLVSKFEAHGLIYLTGLPVT